MLPRLALGKIIEDFVYLHESALDLLPAEWRELVANAHGHAAAAAIETFSHNVLKLNQSGLELSFLWYPDFFYKAFPSLARSVRVSLQNGSAENRDYTKQQNPPILHRKELLLRSDDPRRIAAANLTADAEAVGLFDDPRHIGCKQQWEALLASKGYSVIDNDLLPLSNDIDTVNEVANDFVNCAIEGEGIERYRTALSRSSFSAPVQALLRAGLLNPSHTFFDYGCGRGDDVKGLAALGVDSVGWDPYYAPSEPKRSSAIVNLGFVINVIEDVEQRADTLRDAYKLTETVLSVSAMLSNRTPPVGRPFSDGYLSTRKTFQKYFSQSQLAGYIEQVLLESAIAAGPGVFLVFKDKSLEQRFLLRRYGRRNLNASPRMPLRQPISDRPIRSAKPPKPEREPKQHRKQTVREKQGIASHPLLKEFWQHCIAFGRMLQADEIPTAIMEWIAGQRLSLLRLFRIACISFGVDALTTTRQSRTDDLIVLFAIQRLRKRMPYRVFDVRTQRDVKVFLGSYQAAQALAEAQLRLIGSPEAIAQPCAISAQRNLGWLEPDGQFQFHVDLLPQLPAILRIYVAAATILIGDIEGFDLIKIHSSSGKVTLLKFGNFFESPVPKLLLRVKVDFRNLDEDIFQYGAEYPSPVLFHKSRYMDHGHVGYLAQVDFEQSLAALQLFDLTGYGPSAGEFERQLRESRWEIRDGQLVRSASLPSLDEACGKNFTFRNFVECGETFFRSKITNQPKSADTYSALLDLAVNVLDPAIDYFGSIQLTYGFCSPELSRQIKGRIAPALDQHAGFERNRLGEYVCSRLGAACDFLVEDEDMFGVAEWIFSNTTVDRIYVYGRDRPIHVSYSAHPARVVVQMVPSAAGRYLPREIRTTSEPFPWIKLTA